jgi:hypothetical protein
MCNPHCGVRSNSYKILSLIHRLNCVLPEELKDRRLRLFIVLQQRAREITRNSRAHCTDMSTGLEEQSSVNQHATIEDLCSQVSEDTVVCVLASLTLGTCDTNGNAVVPLQGT